MVRLAKARIIAASLNKEKEEDESKDAQAEESDKMSNKPEER